MGDSKGIRSQRTPRKFVGVGERFSIGARLYEVVRRPDVDLPCDACTGCSFYFRRCPDNVACSSFDRRDGVSVWFRLVGDGEGIRDSEDR